MQNWAYIFTRFFPDKKKFTSTFIFQMFVRRILIITGFGLLNLNVFAQSDDICGYWRTVKGNTQIEISKAANEMFYGKIVWLRTEKDRPDYKNPIEKYRTRKVLGLQILNNFVFDPKSKKWVKGTIYDPENGNTYFCTLWFGKENSILKIRGHSPGIKVLSREAEWIREAKLRE